jgi:hypothetical protein
VHDDVAARNILTRPCLHFVLVMQRAVRYEPVDNPRDFIGRGARALGQRNLIRHSTQLAPAASHQRQTGATDGRSEAPADAGSHYVAAHVEIDGKV